MAIIAFSVMSTWSLAGDMFVDGFENRFDCVSDPSLCVRILALGDTGEGNAEQLCVAEAMSAVCQSGPECNAVLLMGDNFYDNGVNSVDDLQWGTKFETPYDQPGLDGLPFYAVLGEHDYGLGSSGSAQAQIDYSFLPLGPGPGERASDKWNMPDFFYDFVLGPNLVHLFGIDTQDTAGGNPDDQLDDMSQRVADSTATWKIVFAHYPRFTSGDHQGDLQTINTLSEVTTPPGLFAMQQAVYCGADLFLSGHDHNLELIAPGIDASCSNVGFVVSGAGAKTSVSSEPALKEQLFYEDTIEGFVQLLVTPSTVFLDFYTIDQGDCSSPNRAFQWDKAAQ